MLCWSSREEIPPCPRLGAAAGRGNLQGVVAVWAHEGLEEPSHVEGQEGQREEIPLIQGKEQWLCFAGAAMKRYTTSKVRDGRCGKRASEGRHTETIIAEN